MGRDLEVNQDFFQKYSLNPITVAVKQHLQIRFLRDNLQWGDFQINLKKLPLAENFYQKSDILYKNIRISMARDLEVIRSKLINLLQEGQQNQLQVWLQTKKISIKLNQVIILDSNINFIISNYQT
ncbi:hypothetical protein TTHERM_00753600 (macronuclear) [Tetrahymena thermophila SB210]|uniref:Uncharacterized protein n=1 Tax=Tetrahymena thermophila (strain SB210) TaxID=312017 RepID=Q23NG4_TETTS|nr:hypothetical protein TTHERM_00753600 [Tetrahymena thermophila SB210]EAR98110.1 hypothetical protein TTHERM_00753600 [Tetrahymena thermophila SB210]|eukprot:XP_001018355.1 hypothetical protein TTHERM_00753600 [Tetrahymena thermophila SB210]